MSHPECPRLSVELIQYLQATYPEKSPSPGETLDQLRVRSGEATVVRHLTAEFDRQRGVPT